MKIRTRLFGLTFLAALGCDTATQQPVVAPPAGQATVAPPEKVKDGVKIKNHTIPAPMDPNAVAPGP